ncbi:hypothetical protein [Micavibrio aeruginosavorus]|uniref:Uncharacterized protein n=1 Tax=Micavibrio aeruginosavorus EPB TaxID=349215 RepID=M4VGT0_9BACT|nr:hypothetical protein [Micavibrio aeruginosavorus]AGH97690.1 hypothetical protein A11S_867 [Micavibrio aeruginosavorus EPB]
MSEQEIVQLKNISENNDDSDKASGSDLTPFWSYLATSQGHEIAHRVVDFVEDIKKIGLNKHSSHQSLETAAKYFIIAFVVIAVSGLSYFGKLDSTTGMLFGTIVGYFFGQKNEK